MSRPLAVETVDVTVRRSQEQVTPWLIVWREGETTINPIDRPVELRIHGVGGADPAMVLGVDEITPATSDTANDGATGFFVPATDEDRFLNGPDRQLEAYSWSGLTRAAASRAAWLILAPFALTNLAGWMVEHDGDANGTEHELTRADWLSRTLVRLIALTMTLSAVYLTARFAIDLLAIECGSNATCVDRWWLWPIDTFSEWAGRQLLVVSAIPLGLLALVAQLTRRSQLASTPSADPTLERDPTFRDSWKTPAFWSAFGVSHRLGISHLSAGLALIGLLLAGTAEQVSRAPDTPLVIIGACIIGVIAVAINVLRLPVIAYWSVLVASSAYLVAVLVSLATMRSGRFLSGASVASVMDATNTTSQVVLIALLALVTWRGRSRRLRRNASDRYVRWALPLSLFIASAGLISAVGAGSEILIRNLLETPATGTLDVAPTAGIVASAYVIALVVLIVFGLLVYLRHLRQGPTLDEVSADYDGYVDRPDLERIRRARVLARFTDDIPTIVITASVALVVVVILVLTQVAVSGTGLSDPNLENPFGWLENAASVLVLTLPVAGILLLLRSYQSGAVRSVVGVLWDVATFWPRRFHPFAPPSYGERTVPDIRRRLAYHTARGVMLAGHSQGSVLGLAALADESLNLTFVAMLSYGSPVERLYARFFSEYVSPELISEVSDRMEGRWVNLYRDTDFIGGPIRSVEADVRLPDPIEPGGRIDSHFRYEESTGYAEALRRLI